MTLHGIFSFFFKLTTKRTMYRQCRKNHNSKKKKYPRKMQAHACVLENEKKKVNSY